MLTNLHVKNLALIEEENIDFEEGLNILSGETGAGKSIILGSINAALGAKTSPDFIRTGASYGLAELMFDIEDESAIAKIKELGVIDIENGELLISRKITPTRSQIKVNGQNFTSAQTQKLAAYLIDMHGQHDNQALMDDATHINVVDEYCSEDISELKSAMKSAYKQYTDCKSALKELDKDRAEYNKLYIMFLSDKYKLSGKDLFSAIEREHDQLEKLREGEQSDDDTDSISTVGDTAVKHSSFPVIT